MTTKDDRLLDLLGQADPAATFDPVEPAIREAVRRRASALLGQTDERRPAGRLTIAVTVACLAGAVGAVAVLIGGGATGPTGSPPFAAAAIRIAEANPRLLVGEPGWDVVGANEFEIDQGQTDFVNGAEHLNVGWEPARYYRQPDADEMRRAASGPEGSVGNPITPGPGPEIEERFEWVTARGRRALLDYDARGRFYRLLFAPEGQTFVRIEGYAKDDEMTKVRFLSLVDSLYSADVDAWLAALPPQIVRPVEDEAIVDEMLEGIPIPSSVDTDELRSVDLALSRYQLGAKVTGAVACGWLDQWAAAVRSEDGVSADEAVAAMATSPSWSILREMEDQGGWSQLVWEYAREMENDNRGALLGTAGTETTPDGRVYEVGPSYATGLGCDSEQRTPREGG
jgi:hypothetical protein